MRASAREAAQLAELVRIIWPEHTLEELAGIITDYMTSEDSAVFAARADGQRVAALPPGRRLSGRKPDHLFQKDALTGGSYGV